MKGLPKYCKHLYKHNARSRSWYFNTGTTSITACTACNRYKRVRAAFIAEVWSDHLNSRYRQYIQASYHKLELWQKPGVDLPKLVIKFHMDKLDLDYPTRCPQHAGIKANPKRRFGSGFTRRQWKKERELSGGKHKSTSYERRYT